MLHCVFFEFFSYFFCSLGIYWYWYVQQLVHIGVSGVSTVSYVGWDSVVLDCKGFGWDLAS